MDYPRFILFLFVIFCSSVFASSQTSRESGELESHEVFVEKLSQFEHIQGKFSQTIESQSGDVIQASVGDFWIARPGYFRWEVAPPYEQKIIADQEKLIVFDPDLEQATVYNHSLDVHSPMQIFSGDIDYLIEQYTIESVNAENNHSTFTLLPHTEQSHFAKLMIKFHANQIQSLTLIDKIEQRTFIEFSEVNSALPISRSVFQFAYPEGTDVIVNE